MARHTLLIFTEAEKALAETFYHMNVHRPWKNAKKAQDDGIANYNNNYI